MNAERHACIPENAPRFRDWIANRGGVAVWRSHDLSDPAKSFSTPARTVDGHPTPRPTWKVGSEPERIITSEAEVDVITWRELKRFRIAVRRGGQGLVLKLTDASSRRLWREIDKASAGGRESSYYFDYDAQEAVIEIEACRVPLDQWN